MKAIIEKEVRLVGMTSAQYAEVKRRLTFDNPAYLEAQKSGRRTWGINRNVFAYRVEDDGLTVPWGCRYWLHEVDPAVEVEDRGWEVPAEIDSNVELRDYQTKALSALISAGGGVLIAPTGSGKTIIAIALAAAFELRTLVLVRNIALAQQWRDAIRAQTGCEAGIIGDGRDDDGCQFTLGVVQTLINRPELCSGYGLLLVDECHATPASQVMKVLASVNAKYRYGLTATISRRDSMESLTHAALGPVVHEIEDVQGAILPVEVARLEFPFSGRFDGNTEFQQLLAANEARNQMIADLAMRSSQKTPTIILCSTVAHCETLVGMMPDALLVHGSLPKKVRAAAVEAMQTSNLIVGTASLLSEGIDIPRLGILVMASPMSAGDNGAATRLVQAIGRIRRAHGTKRVAHVLDIVDQCPMSWSMWGKRRKVYERYGFKVRDARAA